jgi:phosphonate transport system substrate-binding protein
MITTVRRRRSFGLVSVLLVTLMPVVACGSPEDTGVGGLPGTLQVGIIPNISPDDQRALYEPFRSHLEAELGVDVELFVATDYAGVVVALISGRVDIAYVGGLTYAQAREQAKVVPLVTEQDRETGTDRYLSAIVVRADAPYRTTQDVVAGGATFAFGDPSSTSGSLYPRAMLRDAGARCDTTDLSACPPLESVVFTGGHDAAAQAVLNGSADAAGLELRILHRLEDQGSVPPGALRVIETREVMGYPWVAREGLTQQACDTIRDAFTAITDESLLELMRAERYLPVYGTDYEEILDLADELGLLTSG